MAPRARAKAPQDDGCGGEVQAAELDTQSFEYQRVMDARRRRVAALAQIREQHAKTTPPLPLWLSLLLIALMMWGGELLAEHLWGLEAVHVPAMRV